MSSYVLGVAVVTYRSTATLPECLASIRRLAPDSAVVVVENSGDMCGVRALAFAAAPLDVEVIDPGGNVGYAKGVNLAASRLLSRRCTHLLILNPDVRLTANPLELVPWLAHGDVVAGVLAPADAARGESAAASELRVSNAKRRITLGSSLVQAIVGTRFNGITSIKAGKWISVPQVDGAFMLQTFDYFKCHMLDERFELYFEDVDYCDRARAGRGVVLVGLPVGVHSAGASAAQSSGRAYVVLRVSWARYLRMRYPNCPACLVSVPFAIEFLSRTATRQHEGLHTRFLGFRLALAELRRPGSVRVLEEG